jgi:ATP-dependent Clp protease ATP-binding subunit ClpB
MVCCLNAYGRHATIWPLPEAEDKMPRLALLDLTRKGRQAEDMENKACHLVIGQDEAVHNIGRAYSGLPPGTVPGRPADRNFLFLGRTGSEKTRIVEATTESLVKNRRAVIKMDCAAFQRSHEIAKLIGSAGITKSPPFSAPA